MEKVEGHEKIKISAGDAAVNGLFNGLLGGAGMAVVIVNFSLLAGQGVGDLTYF